MESKQPYGLLDSRIRNVIFDIGMVLLFFDFNRAWAGFKGKCAVSEDQILPRLFAEGLVAKYDRGTVTNEEFITEVRQRLGFRGDDRQLIQIWSDIFTLNKPMAERAMAWNAQGVPLFLLSNTCETHIEFFKREFSLFRIFKGEVYSCREKAMKPEAVIYETLLSRYGLHREETIFIDDRAENVEGAKAVGIRAIQYQGESGFIQSLKDLGSAEVQGV